MSAFLYFKIFESIVFIRIIKKLDIKFRRKGGLKLFKYPIAVTIDTNIFDSAKYDLSENSTLQLLKKSMLTMEKSRLF